MFLSVLTLETTCEIGCAQSQRVSCLKQLLEKQADDITLNLEGIKDVGWIFSWKIG